MDIGVFRTEFPEFADNKIYPSTMITFWAALAEKQVTQCVWGTCWAEGVKLYVAHEITLAVQNRKASSVGGTPGLAGGVPTSKTVGGATVQYDAQTTTEKDAGYWNLTVYGKQFVRLMRIFGVGAVQL